MFYLVFNELSFYSFEAFFSALLNAFLLNLDSA